MVHRSGPGARPPRRGALFLELAIVLPVLLLMCLIAFEFAQIFYYDQLLYNCARNGAIYLTVPPDDPPGLRNKSPYASADAAARAEWPPGTPGPLTVTVNDAAAGGRASVQVAWTYQSPHLGNLIPLPTLRLARTVVVDVAPANPR